MVESAALARKLAIVIGTSTFILMVISSLALTVLNNAIEGTFWENLSLIWLGLMATIGMVAITIFFGARFHDREKERIERNQHATR